jgi:hypothetical protein
VTGVKHEYEIQSSVAFTVSKMILEEHEADFYFVKGEGAISSAWFSRLPEIV